MLSFPVDASWLPRPRFTFARVVCSFSTTKFASRNLSLWKVLYLSALLRSFTSITSLPSFHLFLFVHDFFLYKVKAPSLPCSLLNSPLPAPPRCTHVRISSYSLSHVPFYEKDHASTKWLLSYFWWRAGMEEKRMKMKAIWVYQNTGRRMRMCRLKYGTNFMVLLCSWEFSRPDARPDFYYKLRNGMLHSWSVMKCGELCY